MIESAQLIYVCDHIVQSEDSIFTVDQVQRGNNSDSDIVCAPSIIGEIESVYETDENGEGIYYYENTDFIKLGSSLIQWVDGGNKPSVGSFYTIEYLKVTRAIEQYVQESCPKCNGNGWYVDITNKSGFSMGVVTGVDKITQDFIKLLLTQSSDGSRDLFYYISKGNYTDTTEGIANFIKKCETTYMKKQSDLVGSGTIVDSNELLSRIIISNVEFDEDLLAYFITTTLVTSDGASTEVSLKV